MKKFAWLCIILFCVLLVGIMVVWGLIRGSGTDQAPPPETRVSVYTPAPPKVPTATQRPPTGSALIDVALTMENPSFSSDWQREVTALEPDHKVLVTITEEHLNNEIAAYLVQHPNEPYRDIVAAFYPDEFTVQATVFQESTAFQLLAGGELNAASCVPQITVTEVSIGWLPAPAAVRQQITTLVADLMKQFPADFPICITDMQIEQGQLSIVGVRR